MAWGRASRSDNSIKPFLFLPETLGTIAALYNQNYNQQHHIYSAFFIISSASRILKLLFYCWRAAQDWAKNGADLLSGSKEFSRVKWLISLNFFWSRLIIN
jgi:hypothetical protein